MITSSVSLVDILTLVVAVLLPLLNGLITKQSLAPALKGTVLAGLALATSVLSEFIVALTAGEPFDIGQSLLRWGAVFVVAVASYFGILSRPLTRQEPAILEPVVLPDYEQYTLAELRPMAEERGISLRASAKKADFVNELEAWDVNDASLEIVGKPIRSIAEIVSAHGVK